MKVQKKTLFAAGLALALLGGLWMGAELLHGDLDGTGMLLFVIGCDFILRSFSEVLEVENLDERGQFIQLKASRKALELINLSFFVGILVFRFVPFGPNWPDYALIVAIVWGFMTVVETCTFLYYEKHL